MAQLLQHSNPSAHLSLMQNRPSLSNFAEPAHQQTGLCFTSHMTSCNLQSTQFAASGWCPFQAASYQSKNASVTAQQYHAHWLGVLLKPALSAIQHMGRHVPVLDPDTKFYLLVLLGIAAANSIFTFVRAFSFAYGGLAAARKLHEQLLSAIILAPAKFFNTTPAGDALSIATLPASKVCPGPCMCQATILLSSAVCQPEKLSCNTFCLQTSAVS